MSGDGAASPLTSPTSRSSRGRVILKLSVQLPDGQKGSIHVFPGSDPRELAEQFCEKHALSDPKLLRVVERHIVENMRHLSTNQHTPPSSAASEPRGGGDSRLPPPQPPPPLSNGGGLAAAASSSSAGCPSGLVRARELAVHWRASARSKQLLRCCWGTFVGLLWQGRMRRLRDTAHVEASAARAAEIEELHAANARIATLAFAQAGRSPEQAADELRALLEPNGTSARRAQQQLERVLAREVRRRELSTATELKRRAMAAMATGARAGPPAAAESSQATIARLTQRVAELSTEVEELTTQLISAKLLQAELAAKETTAVHEKRVLERQLVITSAEVEHEIDYFDAPTHGRQAGRVPPQRKGGLNRGISFPSRKTR
jgi:hypothetical protein